MLSLRRIRAEKAKRKLSEFVKQAWAIVEPGKELIWNWHLDAICDHVQALLEGRLGKKNLLINVPPGSMKSTIVSVCAPAWWWLHQPGWRGIFASGSDSVAMRDSIKCRDILDSDWYRRLFQPEWRWARDQNAKGHFKNTRQGFRMALTAGAKVTGDRADGLFVDDPLDAQEAYSKAARDQKLIWWDQAFANRLNNASTGTRCVIMQRLHEEDLAGHVLELEASQWELLLIPQEWEESARRTTSLGWTDPRTQEGELMFPARFPEKDLVLERARLGSSGYAGQHQQRPAAKEGEIFKRGFVQFYDPAVPLPEFRRRVMSWDTAFKEKTQNDPSAGLVGAEADRGIYLLDHVAERMSYPALKEKAKTWGAAHHPSALLIEDKASGQSLIQELQLETSLPVVPVQVDTDKVARAWACVPTWEARRIFLPKDAPWVDGFLTELYTFPKAAHDDQVDAFTQLVRYLTLGGGSTGLADWLQQEVARAEAERKQAKEAAHAS